MGSNDTLDADFILETYKLNHTGTYDELTELEERAKQEDKLEEHQIGTMLSVADTTAVGGILKLIGTKYKRFALAGNLLTMYGGINYMMKRRGKGTLIGATGERLNEELDKRWPAFTDDFAWTSDEELLEDLLFTKAEMDSHTYTGIHSQAELEAETALMYPILEDLVGSKAIPYPTARFMTEEESDAINENFPAGTSFSTGKAFRINHLLQSTDTEERVLHNVVAHELCHCASSNEAATQLRGMEVNARLPDSDSNRYAFFAELNYWAALTAVIKDIHIGVSDELRDLAEETISTRWKLRGTPLKELFEDKVNEIRGGDEYSTWAYRVVPYKAFKLAVAEELDEIEIPQTPGRPEKLTAINMSVLASTLYRKWKKIDQEDPLDMTSSLELYTSARDAYRNPPIAVPPQVVEDILEDMATELDEEE